MFKGLPETGEYAPLWSGLFRPLWSPASEGTLVCSGVSSETEDLGDKYLVGVLLIMKKASAWFRRLESRARAYVGEEAAGFVPEEAGAHGVRSIPREGVYTWEGGIRSRYCGICV